MAVSTVARTGKKARRRAPKPRMTAEQARTFSGGESLESYIAVAATLADRNADHERFADCDCEPYSDVFTFHRWVAQGRVVRKGEKAMAHLAFVPTGRSREETDEQGATVTKPILRPKTTHLFCACQTEPAEGKPS
jgi:hypothetical protein